MCECVCVVCKGGRSQGCSWLCHLQQLFPSNPASPAPPPSHPIFSQWDQYKGTGSASRLLGPNQSHHYSRVRIFTGNSFSENMPAVQGVWYYCLIGLVCFRFLFSPLFFTHQSQLTKGHIDSSRPRARHTVTVVRSLGKPGTVFSGAGWLLCTLWKGHSCCACSGFLDSHPELSDCLLKPCERSWAQRVRRCESPYMITRTHSQLCLLKPHL